ncbi:hypothetical protein HYS54_02670 [Candidatus Micrarchaeota archaeon]|nr:hypothetical protein [Candidatus Micrarchaeota archaeon]
MARMEMIQVPKAEYEKLKQLSELEELDAELVKKVLKALNNFKQGKFKEWT